MDRQRIAIVTSRRGVSLWEITGAIVAVVAGVWLGARYLGLDLHAAAYTALNDTEINERLPEGWRLAPPVGMEPQTPQQQAVALTAELEEIRHEVAQLNSESAAEQAAFTVDPAGKLHPDLIARRQHTLAFWSQLGGIREEVDRLQLSADEALNQNNVYKVLEIRRRAYLYGAKAVKVAMSDKVDPQALHFAEQLRGWYQHGADLYGEALNVWQAQHVPSEGLSSDQLLDRIQKQHDNEALLLFQKSGRLCEVLFRRYQVAFPVINEPGSGAN
ncbi:hypothetical protein [Aeoliella sp. SH292]|uniref:hypothetical protein n=1 Tax=Aeoliella sp. SH292 TaxID=3454464 RepID=UPI003F98BDAC